MKTLLSYLLFQIGAHRVVRSEKAERSLETAVRHRHVRRSRSFCDRCFWMGWMV